MAVVIGKMNTLTVARVRDSGIYLDGGVSGEVLLPPREAPPACQVGDRLELFVYVDSDGTLLATPQRPFALAGEFAYLKVLSLTPHGAFLDWGLKKNLLVPYGEQNGRMEEGRSYIVYLYREPDTQRIAASAKLERFIDTEWPPYQRGEQVDLLICEHTDLGYKAIVDHRHWGVLHDEDVFETLRYGDRRTGYIKKVRDDGKLDLMLHPAGYAKIDTIAAMILEKLRSSGGYLPVGDKTPPETIQQLFGISKKSFKQALSALYRERLITLEKEGIRLAS
ncbi:MAG TPA: S1-like domain-containing RNA-binding protein [Gammaproteobacteria bacterium]